MSAIVEHSDCRAYLATLATNSLDACTTDPPYELNFMGRGWDRSGIANQVELWREVYRVLKPGAHLVACGGTRTYHRMVCAIEDAGFEIRDTLQWLYGSGFNKSRNVLKPAHEPIVLARKPLAKTVAATIAAYGTGGINVEACRVDTSGKKWSKPYGGYWHTDSDAKSELVDNTDGRWPPNMLLSHSPACKLVGTRQIPPTRWGKGSARHNGPDTTQFGFRGDAPIETTGYEAPDGTETVPAYECAPDCAVAALDRQSGISSGASRFYPILNYDPVYDDPFLYCAKASRRERNAGLAGMPQKRGPVMSARCVNCGHGRMDGRREGACCHNPQYESMPVQGNVANHHPTVKPITLCRWLVRLVTPIGGTTLDPFAGSGSFGVACVLEGRHYKGCDQDAEYVEIANRRIAATQPALIGV